MASAEWTWDLHDGAGNRLGEFTTATGKQVAFKRNWYSEATCTISVDDAMATTLNTALASGWPRLRLYRRAVGAATAALVFYGWLAPIVASAEVGSTLQIVARSPFARHLGMACFGDSLNLSVATRAAQSRFLLSHGTSPLPPAAMGLNVGTDTTSAITSSSILTPSGTDIGQRIVDYTKQLGADFDFNERFNATAVSADLAFFDTTDSLGSDKPNAKFEYGETTLANLRAAQVITSPPINYVIVFGANGLGSRQQNAGSQTTYGIWGIPGGAVTLPQITDQVTLDARANALLRPNPVKTFQMTPDATAPKPWDDFFIGDTVHVYANRGGLQLASVGARVNAFTVVIDDEGLEQSSIPDPVSPEEEAFIHAGLTVEL